MKVQKILRELLCFEAAATAFLAEVAYVGSQDIYTDAWEYRDRVDAMRRLVDLASKLLAGEGVTEAQVYEAAHYEEESADAAGK